MRIWYSGLFCSSVDGGWREGFASGRVEHGLFKAARRLRASMTVPGPAGWKQRELSNWAGRECLGARRGVKRLFLAVEGGVGLIQEDHLPRTATGVILAGRAHRPGRFAIV